MAISQQQLLALLFFFALTLWGLAWQMGWLEERVQAPVLYPGWRLRGWLRLLGVWVEGLGLGLGLGLPRFGELGCVSVVYSLDTA